MPVLFFHWNNLGFNDVPANPNLRNGVVGQTQAAIVANLEQRIIKIMVFFLFFEVMLQSEPGGETLRSIYLGMRYSIYLCDLDNRLM